MKTLRFLTATTVHFTGVCSFRFYEHMPREWRGHGHFYGMVIPFEGGERHSQDTSIYIFECGKGQIMTGAFLASDVSDPQLHDILKDGWIAEEIIFLLPRAVFDQMKPVLDCYGNLYTVEVYHHEGEVSTS